MSGRKEAVCREFGLDFPNFPPARIHSSKTHMELLTAKPLPENDARGTRENQQTAALDKQSSFKSLAKELFACSNSSPKKLCEIIGRDVALKAEVISQANAFIFSFGRPVRSLSQAIACLGYARCRKLVAIRLGAEDIEEEVPDERTEGPKSETAPIRRLPGIRPYRKQRLSSLYPPKSRRQKPHFFSVE